MKKRQYENPIRKLSQIALVSISVALAALLGACDGDIPIPEGAWTVKPGLACPGDLLEYTWTELVNITEAKIEPDVGAVALSSTGHTETFDQERTYVFLATNDKISDFVPLPLIETFALDKDNWKFEKEVTNAEELPRQFVTAAGQRTERRDPAWPGEWVCQWETSVPASEVSDRVIMRSIKNEMPFGVSVSRFDLGFNHAFGPFEEIDDSNPVAFGTASGGKFSGKWTFEPSPAGFDAFVEELQKQIELGELEDCAGFVIQISVVVACSE